MKFKFDPNLEFQAEAINSIVELFSGQIKQPIERVLQVTPNILTLPAEKVFENLQEVQQKNDLEISDTLENQPYNFTVEMETGTGKTYVYLRTIFELNRKYGFTKFIIVVPSVAIKEGVLKTLDITKEHFKKLYENLPYNYFTYESGNLNQIRIFALKTNLQIMVLTRDAFNKELNIIHKLHDRMGDKPIELIKKTNPIVILDEPQKMGGEASKWGISELNPLFILRYSATHREVHNLVHKLTPYDAYNHGLVKKIEVASVTEDGDPSRREIILEDIYAIKSGLRAKVRVFVRGKKGIRLKIRTVKNGDDLQKKTDNTYYDGFIVSEVNKGLGYITFSNGVKIYEGQSSTDRDEIMRAMLQETIRGHLERKRNLNPKGVKVLSLFFINRVDDYLPESGWLRQMFEEELRKLVMTEFPQESHFDVENTHSGYFSRMKRRKSIEGDGEAYKLIMRKKERLLSLDESVEFIFSHSALREGWDNPNVFNICVLSYARSEIKKRQEIGRGLRLPVNADGERIHDRNINVLTVVTNETYREYVDQLQTEFMEDVGVAPPPVENNRDRKSMVLKKDVLETEPFEGLWKKIAKKAKYVVDIDIDRFVDQCVKTIDDEIRVKPLTVNVQRRRIEKIEERIGEKIDPMIIREEFISEKSERVKPKSLFNAVNQIENETKLTKSTILKILRKANNLHQLFDNPSRYVEKIVGIIRDYLKKFSVERVKYIEFDDYFDQSLFNGEISTYDKYIVLMDNKKTLYEVEGENNDGVKIDSGIEKTFAQELDRDSRIKVFIKLPDWYKLETPAGNYIPDWAMLVETKKEGAPERNIYFVVETKGTNDIHGLRPNEWLKISSAKKRFEVMENVSFSAPIDSYSEFTESW